MYQAPPPSSLPALEITNSPPADDRLEAWKQDLQAELKECREITGTFLTVSGIVAGLSTTSLFAMLRLPTSNILTAVVIILAITATTFMLGIMLGILQIMTVASMENSLRGYRWVYDRFESHHPAPEYLIRNLEVQTIVCGAGFFFLSVTISVAGFLYSKPVGIVSVACGVTLSIYMASLARLTIGRTETLMVRESPLSLGPLSLGPSSGRRPPAHSEDVRSSKEA